MKKLVTLTMVVVMVCTMFTGCFSDPVAVELENYANVQMKEVNENYKKFTAEFAKVEQSKSLEELTALMEKTLLVNINDSLDKLSKIELTTDEVKGIKAMYVKSMEKYKDGLNDFIAAMKSDNTQGIDAASAKLDEATKLYDEYNKAYEALVKEKGMELE